MRQTFAELRFVPTIGENVYREGKGETNYRKGKVRICDNVFCGWTRGNRKLLYTFVTAFKLLIFQSESTYLQRQKAMSKLCCFGIFL